MKLVMGLRSIYAALAIPALALSLAVCAMPPELALLKQCGDGTYCPIQTACFADAECLRCEAVSDLSGWTSCGADLCPQEGGCPVDRSACMRDCHREGSTTCGNGTIDGKPGGPLGSAEECDDGNSINDDGCDRNCKRTGCGNGVPTTGEECDDGNLLDGDGCDHACKKE